jgi:hypothetical protein
MKKQIEVLVKLGIDKSEALTIVRNIAMYAFEEGGFNIDYSEEHGLDTDKTFDEWFKEELNR